MGLTPLGENVIWTPHLWAFPAAWFGAPRPGWCFPDLHGAIPAGRGKELPVGAVRHAPDPACVGAEREETVPFAGIPDPHRCIRGGRGDPLAVGAVRHA